jgi:gliding motility-associated-like protein
MRIRAFIGIPFLMVLSILLAHNVYAQKQNNQWRFGYNAGIDFNTTPPTYVSVNTIQTTEGSASVADRNTGALLFYTDGVTVWDSLNQVMPNGTGLLGGSAALLSSSTAAVIIPKPGSANLYYIVTIDELSFPSNGLRYSVVDMSLNGGRGDIVPAQKNILLFQTNCEKVEVVPAAACQNFWVITHDLDSSFYAFLLTPSGFQPNPVVSPLVQNSTHFGQLKVNSQFNKLVCGNFFNFEIELYDFDNATGVVSNPIIWASPSQQTNYGFEFSPNGKVLYVTDNTQIFQYDLTQTTAATIAASAFPVVSSPAPFAYYTGLQLGPDGKVYCHPQCIDVISNPDQLGAGCNYQSFVLFGDPCASSYCFPKIVYTEFSGIVNDPPLNVTACNSYTAPWGTVYTQSGTYTDTISNANSCDSIKTLNLTITGTVVSPTVFATACSTYTSPWGTVYSQSGVYNDTLTTVNGCDSIVSVNLTITGSIVTPPVTATACSSYTASWGTVYTQSGVYSDTLTTVNGCDSIISVNLTITGTLVTPPQNVSSCNSYTAPWGTVYTLSGTYSDTLISVNGCDSIVSINLSVFSDVFAPPVTASACGSYTAPSGMVYNQSGIYTDTLSTVNGCDSITSLNLTINNIPSLSTTSAPDTCGKEAGTAQAIATGGTGLYTYSWSNGLTGSSLSNLSSGTYTVTVTDQNGCSTSTLLNVSDIPVSPVTVTSSATFINEGDSVQLNASGAISYMWTPPSGLSCTACSSPNASPVQTTTYLVTGTDNNGCVSTQSITINVDIRCAELFIPSIFSPNGSGPVINEELCVWSNCIREMEFGIYNRWGELIFETTDPKQCWDGTKNDKEVPGGVYTYRLSVKLLNGKSVRESGNITLVR